MRSSNRISLGLDLKGGTHLVLQVMVDEAVAAETDNAVGRLQGDLQAAGISVGSVGKPNPSDPVTLQISGVPADKTGDVRNLLDTKYGQQYNISSTSDGFTLTLKPTEQQALETKTLQQSIETISTRINSLGVTEPTVQEYGLGKNQILVELPGVDDPGRVRDIIQSTAILEIHAVTGGPYATQDAAKQANGGVIAPDQELVPYGGNEEGLQGQYYLLQRVAVVRGPGFPRCAAGTGRKWPTGCDLYPDPRCRRPLLRLHQQEREQADGDHAGQQGPGGREYPGGDPRSGPHLRPGRAEGQGPVADAADGRAAGLHPLP